MRQVKQCWLAVGIILVIFSSLRSSPSALASSPQAVTKLPPEAVAQQQDKANYPSSLFASSTAFIWQFTLVIPMIGILIVARRRYIRRTLGSVSCLALVGLSLVSCTVGTTSAQWCANNASTSFDLKKINLSSVSMPSVDEGWAVGAGILLHYSNHQWAELSGQNIPGLTSVSMQSTSLGLVGGDKGEILRYIGGCWKEEVGEPPSLNGLYPHIFSTVALSYDSAWAVGWNSTINRYSKGSWSDQSQLANTGGGASLNSIYMLSEDDGWIVGSDINGGSVILRYQNGRWVKQPSPPSMPLNSVMFISQNEGWAVGNEYKQNEYKAYEHDGVAFHYLNGNWSVVSIPGIENLHSVYMLSAADGWAVGADRKNSGAILHLINGQWQPVATPKVGELLSIAMVSANEGWAVGNGVILHYQNGTWQQWQQ